MSCSRDTSPPTGKKTIIAPFGPITDCSVRGLAVLIGKGEGGNDRARPGSQTRRRSGVRPAQPGPWSSPQPARPPTSFVSSISPVRAIHPIAAPAPRTGVSGLLTKEFLGFQTGGSPGITTPHMKRLTCRAALYGRPDVTRVRDHRGPSCPRVGPGQRSSRDDR